MFPLYLKAGCLNRQKNCLNGQSGLLTGMNRTTLWTVAIDPCFLNNIVGAFFIILLRSHGSHVILPEVDTQGHDENVMFILKYMQENYKTVSLKELAEFFNYSERQIQRIIKNSTGSSFSKNIQKLKMRQAARLLANPDMSISSIAEDLGYIDIGNFRHIFKKYYRMTPAEYREQN